MADLSRRGFLTQVSVTTGIGIAGGLGLHNALLGGSGGAMQLPAAAGRPASPVVPPTVASAPPALAMDNVTLGGPMVVHIRDLATAEVSMMVGAQEMVYRDPDLVARLVKTANAAGQAEG
jgi:hypothetical protein